MLFYIKESDNYFEKKNEPKMAKACQNFEPIVQKFSLAEIY